MSYKKDFTEFMIASGVLLFGDFVTKSGRNTPYFINTGNYRTGAQIAALSDFYARNVAESGEEFDILYGPAYKGIPLVTTTAAALWRNHGIDKPYFFNRKESKDHGEGGLFVGAKPEPGMRVAIIEDVTTAGTAIRETMELFESVGGLTITALYVSADRQERGTGDKTALDELRDDYGINIYPIITASEVIASLSDDNPYRAKMLDYLAEYGPCLTRERPKDGLNV